MFFMKSCGAPGCQRRPTQVWMSSGMGQSCKHRVVGRLLTLFLLSYDPEYRYCTRCIKNDDIDIRVVIDIKKATTQKHKNTKHNSKLDECISVYGRQ